jgi:hypothetical protein
VRRGRDLGPVIVQGLTSELRTAWSGALSGRLG